ncbi:hypothetical protein M3Y99_00139900 [Aphelenchoides fujianensis]|nr:hypothetical protein M3Y99_00139900 [Aphelenchoides fujianensis]
MIVEPPMPDDYMFESRVHQPKHNLNAPFFSSARMPPLVVSSTVNRPLVSVNSSIVEANDQIERKSIGNPVPTVAASRFSSIAMAAVARSQFATISTRWLEFASN